MRKTRVRARSKSRSSSSASSGSRRVQRRSRPPKISLEGQVAVVAGATRGAGRGIALALGEAGAKVYCTGRSVRGKPSSYGRPETIEETAELIERAGGTAVAVRVDHSVESEVQAFFAELDARDHRLDVLVNSLGGDDPLMKQHAAFWEADFSNGTEIFRSVLISHMITAKHAAPIMIRARRGLIVEVTEADMLGGGGNPVAKAVKMEHKIMALNMASELAPHGVAAVAITPGYLRSERMLETHGVTESNWRDYGKVDPNWLESESPQFVGRGIVALMRDPQVMAHTGQLLSSWQLGREYRLTDVDGRRPDWGALDVDYSSLPAEMIEYFRVAAGLEAKWAETIAARTRRFIKQLPLPKPAKRRAMRR
jgi:NAD(P)-dependent dehydrogenase (short-subunit alcohol dehydrogenase family)